MKKQKLGEILVQSGFVSEEQINRALQIQVGGNRRLGRILIKLGYVTEDQLLEIISQQLEKPIVNLSKDISADTRRVMPRYLCRKYSVLPLNIEDGRVLKLAMLDPSDEEAIQDIETYTGLVVMPVLGRQNEISRGIEKFIPLSLKDVLNPQVSNTVLRAAYALALVLVIALSAFLYRAWHVDRYGTISQLNDTYVFKNHDLMLVVEASGQVRMFGHGAFAPGLYDVQFNDANTLSRFIDNKRKGLSEKQYRWLSWVIETRLDELKG